MTGSGERDIITDSALESEGNFKIAVNIGLAFDRIRKKVILRFLDSLEKDLRDSLSDEWAVENTLKENVFGRYEGLFFHKKSWLNRYFIRIEPQYYNAKGFIFGVSKGEKEIPTIDDLKERLDDEYRQGYSSDYWVWWQWFDSPYRDWDNEESLMNLYTGEALEYFKDIFDKIKNIAPPLIDSRVK